MPQQVIIDVSASAVQPRVVRWTTLADFYDAGLHTLILSIMLNGLWAVQTIGALHNSIVAALQGNNDGLLAVLDYHTLRLFIDDMQANGYNLAMSDKLLTGVRPPAPTLAGGNAAAGGAGFASITAQLDLVHNTDKIWILLTPTVSGLVQERLVDVTQDGAGWFTVDALNLPANTYTAKLAAVNNAGLRGFISVPSNAFVVT